MKIVSLLTLAPWIAKQNQIGLLLPQCLLSKAVFPLAKFSKITPATEMGLFLFLSHHPRWPEQVNSLSLSPMFLLKTALVYTSLKRVVKPRKVHQPLCPFQIQLLQSTLQTKKLNCSYWASILVKFSALFANIRLG